MTMTPEQLVSGLFEPVANHVKDYLRKAPVFQLEAIRSSATSNHGIECWFAERIRHARPQLVSAIRSRGPDLTLRDETQIELKAATNCAPGYMAGTYKEKRGELPRPVLVGWQKYLSPHCPDFAGCLFLGDGFKDGSHENKIKDRIKEIEDAAKRNVKLHKRRCFRDAGNNWWLLGLLLSTKYVREHSSAQRR